MAIKNGELIDADEIMNVSGALFNDMAQTIFEQDYNGFDSRLNNSGTPDYNNVVYDTLRTDNSTTKIGFSYDSSKDLHTTDLSIGNGEGSLVYDDFSDDIIDTNKWATTGVVTESSSILKGENQYNVAPNQAWTIETKELFTNRFMIFQIDNLFTNAGGGATTTVGFRLTGDGGGPTIIKQWSGSNLDTDISNVWLYVEIIGDSVWTKYYNDAWVENDISGWSNVQVEFYGIGGTFVGNRVRLGNIWYYNSDTHTYISQDYAISDVVTNLIPITNQTVDSNSSVVNSVSADGSNFETITLNNIHRPTNTGTQINNKVVVTTDASIPYHLQETIITEEAIKYNLY